MPSPDSPAGGTLAQLLDPLTQTEGASPQLENEPWEQTIERISDPDRVAEITEKIWDYFFEVLPPKLFAGRWFAFAEGQEPLRIFWKREQRFFVRQLTEEVSMRVCELTGLPKDYGAY